MKIAVALSGGVDSTTVARRLLDQGHEVIGITMQLCPDLSDMPSTAAAKAKALPGLPEHGCTTCVAPCACLDGRAAAQSLGIQHELIDFRDQFESLVIKPFVDYFSQGLTPNPCAFCNREIKFGVLLDQALKLGADAMATGHYADLDTTTDPIVLKRAKDQTKDQTYFLSLVANQRFKNVLFPLSQSMKEDVSAQARNLGLMEKETATSNEICFLRELSHVDFIRHRAPHVFTPGDIVDSSGKKLGVHQGLPHFTIGQRRGIGVAARSPLYVVGLRVKDNQVVVGADKELMRKQVKIRDFNWAGNLSEQEQDVEAMIRYRQTPRQARLKVIKERYVELTFDQPIRAVTPGQVAAIYVGQRLMGGGMIDVDGSDT